MNASRKKGDEYYPFRWKVADFVENIIILHRTRAALAIAAFGILLILVGAFVLGWRPGGSDDTATPGQDQGVEQVENDQTNATNPPDGTPTQDEALGIENDGSGNDQANSGIEGNIRPIATDAQLRFTRPGLVIELGPTVMALTGGFTSDAAADAAVQRAIALFPTREVLDSQILSETFAETDELTVRLGEPTLFAEGTADFNTDFVPLVADVASVILSSGELTVEVVGHVPGPARSTNRARAISNELINQGVAANIVSFTGLGNTQPLPGFDSRIEFVIR